MPRESTFLGPVFPLRFSWLMSNTKFPIITTKANHNMRWREFYIESMNTFSYYKWERINDIFLNLHDFSGIHENFYFFRPWNNCPKFHDFSTLSLTTGTLFVLRSHLLWVSLLHVDVVCGYNQVPMFSHSDTVSRVIFENFPQMALSLSEQTPCSGYLLVDSKT